MDAEFPRWLLMALIAMLVAGLLVWARGPEHHRGQYVGSLHPVAAGSELSRI